jgi:L-lactate dehydrogenase complex protein LldE
MAASRHNRPVPVANLFVTCLIDSLFPEVGESVVRVLRAAGADVRFWPEQTCCGQPAFNAGSWPEARRMAHRTIVGLESLTGDIVVPSGSCAAMIRHGYLELFREEPGWQARARRLAPRVWEFSQYMRERLGFLPQAAAKRVRVAYHPSCHLLRGLGIDRQPRELLEALGVEPVWLEADCCGFGGVFAVDQPEISEAMLDRRLDQIRESRAEIVVAADVSCLMHLEGALRRSGAPTRCLHLAQILDDRSGGLR